VEAIAAGTFATIDMTALRFNVIKIFATSMVNFLKQVKFNSTHSGNQVSEEPAENTTPLSADTGTEIFMDIRNDEVIQAVCEHHIDKLTLGTGRPGKLECRQKEDGEIEGHTVDKCGREKPAICRRNDTTLVRDPCRSQQDPVEQ
jgi:hypothetical protein